jgi:hypothetical protein
MQISKRYKIEKAVRADKEPNKGSYVYVRAECVDDDDRATGVIMPIGERT